MLKTYLDIHWFYRFGYRELQEESPKPLVRSLVRSVRATAGALRKLVSGRALEHRKRLRGDAIWFFVTTRNQLSSLESVFHALPEAQLLTTPDCNLEGFVTGNSPATLDICARAAWLWKPQVILTELAALCDNSMRRVPSRATLPVGVYEELEWLFRTKRPSAVILSNDHAPLTRAVRMAAESAGVPTVYIPHANVTPKYPPLEFDLSLLPGPIMLKTYEQCGPVRGHTKLIGTPKLDDYRSCQNEKALQTLGVCFNEHDDSQKVLETCDFITNQLPNLRILLRPHPRQADLASRFSGQHEISNPIMESSLAFISRVGGLVTYNSSIALEATILNRPTIFFDYSGTHKNYDVHRFVANNLVYEAKTHGDLVSQLADFQVTLPTVSHRAAEFEAVRERATTSTSLAVEAIRKLSLPTNETSSATSAMSRPAETVE